MVSTSSTKSTDTDTDTDDDDDSSGYVDYDEKDDDDDSVDDDDRIIEIDSDDDEDEFVPEEYIFPSYFIFVLWGPFVEKEKQLSMFLLGKITIPSNSDLIYYQQYTYLLFINQLIQAMLLRAQ